MADLYYQNGTTPAAIAPAPIAIASSTNASPIVVTTAAPHGYGTGTWTVQIVGHQVNTAANGLWQAEVTGASTFRLIGSTGTGVGGATGVAQNMSVGPVVTLPADGDLADAASVNGPNESAADVAPYLFQRVGAYNLHAVYQTGTFTSQTNTFSSTALTTATWVPLTGLTDIFSASSDRYLASGDLLEVEFGTTILLTRGIAVVRYAMAIGLTLNGGAASAQSGSVRVVQLDNAISTTDYMPVSFAMAIDSGFSADDRFDISILANKDSAAAYNLDLIAGYSITVKHYRSNV